MKNIFGVSQNLKYGTNIDLNKKSYNDWNAKLLEATKKSVNISDKSIKEKYFPIIHNIEKKSKNITIAYNKHRKKQLQIGCKYTAIQRILSVLKCSQAKKKNPSKPLFKRF